jgi:hexosaminidase
MLFALQAATTPLPLVPLPVSVRRDSGALRLGRPITLVAERGAKDEAATLAEGLKADGVFVGANGAKVTLRLVPGLPPEGYRLKVSPDGATLEATTGAGLFYAGQTLRQLVQPNAIPAVTIEDAPRFGWRGMLLDVSRHFFTPDEVKRFIDLNARQKLNVFHWHLTDDGGWRVESKAFPLLTKRGAWRDYPPKGKWDYSNIVFPEKRSGDEYGGFYTQKEIKDVVAYAAKRHVTIVPEIEMPGHSQAALQCYPQFGHDNLPAGQKSYSFCGGKEETFRFLEKIMDETMALFPSKFIHIGGDEVDKAQWRTCPSCQSRIKSEGLKDVEELQSYFVRRMDKYLASKGRRLVGWDEILEGGLAPGATVMSWRGIQGGIAAAKEGKDVVMSPTSHLYLDYSYDTIPTSLVYAYDPIPKELTAEEAKHVLGAQGNVWTEWLPDMKDIERMSYPRGAALAEATWTPLERKSWPEFSQRLDGVLDTLDRLGVSYRVDSPTFERSAFLSTEPVSLTVPTVRRGWSLRMTTDGTPVTSTSHLVDRLELAPGTVGRFAFVRNRDGVLSPETQVEVRRGGPVPNPGNLKPGLNVYAQTGTFEKVPVVEDMNPVGTATTIDLSRKPAPEKFALRFTGYVFIPEEGDYAFTISSDDGAVLKISGLSVVDHDGQHGATAKSGRIRLRRGLYPIDLGYFDAGGASSLAVTVTPPNGPETTLPADWLFH